MAAAMSLSSLFSEREKRCRCDFLREKRAVSDPEKKADRMAHRRRMDDCSRFSMSFTVNHCSGKSVVSFTFNIFAHFFLNFTFGS